MSRLAKLWYNDVLQFARLLCELRAGGALADARVVNSVLTSTDMTQEELTAVLDRAHLVFEFYKAKLPSAPKTAMLAKLQPEGQQLALVDYYPETSMFSAYPRGGGFERRVPSGSLTPMLGRDLEPVYRRGKASIDHEEGGETFACWHDPDDLWNGWNCPSFERDVIEGPLRRYLEDGGSRLEWDPESRTYTVFDRDDPDPSSTGTLLLIPSDGRVIETWDIGSRCWVWRVEDLDAPAPAG